jgi:hypothetical protein
VSSPEEGSLPKVDSCITATKATLILDYRFLPQNVSEVGRKKKEEKKRHRGPNVQIVTVGHYCDQKMV